MSRPSYSKLLGMHSMRKAETVESRACATLRELSSTAFSWASLFLRYTVGRQFLANRSG